MSGADTGQPHGLMADAVGESCRQKPRKLTARRFSRPRVPSLEAAFSPTSRTSWKVTPAERRQLPAPKCQIELLTVGNYCFSPESEIILAF